MNTIQKLVELAHCMAFDNYNCHSNNFGLYEYNGVVDFNNVNIIKINDFDDNREGELKRWHAVRNRIKAKKLKTSSIYNGFIHGHTPASDTDGLLPIVGFDYQPFVDRYIGIAGLCWGHLTQSGYIISDLDMRHARPYSKVGECGLLVVVAGRIKNHNSVHYYENSCFIVDANNDPEFHNMVFNNHIMNEGISTIRALSPKQRFEKIAEEIPLNFKDYSTDLSFLLKEQERRKWKEKIKKEEELDEALPEPKFRKESSKYSYKY